MPLAVLSLFQLGCLACRLSQCSKLLVGNLQYGMQLVVAEVAVMSAHGDTSQLYTLSAAGVGRRLNVQDSACKTLANNHYC